MKSFLTRGKRPIIKWGMLPSETYFEGTVPEGFSLAVSPSEGYVIIDVDRHGNIDGFDNIPEHLQSELDSTLSYATKNNGKHYWFKYTGGNYLANKTSSLGIDLRTSKGYVIWYPKENVKDCMPDVKESSATLNKWLEKLFSYVD
jgi:hypothetical protein